MPIYYPIIDVCACVYMCVCMFVYVYNALM
jgi:hypothetical protein